MSRRPGLRDLFALFPCDLARAAGATDVRPAGACDQRRGLVNILDDSRPAFAQQTRLIRARLLGGNILQSDETSVRVGTRTWWTWVFHHGDDCCFVIRPSRGTDVVAEVLGDVRPDFWVSDRFAAQMGWAKTDNQVCLAHLIASVNR